MMTAFGDMQSLMAVGSGLSSGIGMATAGTSWALSKGSSVVKGGSNLMGSGISNVTGMFNKGKTLTPEQKSVVQNTISQHNPRKAYEQVGDFLKQNQNRKTNNDNVMKYSNSNPFKQPYSMKYNPIRNQYMSQNNSDNIYDRKWY